MKAKMKRVFAFNLNANFPLGSATYPAPTGWAMAVLSYVPEEDIVIIGYSVNAIVGTINPNDGQAYMACEITQSPEIGAPGSICHVNCQEYWNTSPAGIMIQEDHSNIMFPEGHGIPLRDGVPVMVHMRWHAKSSGEGELSLRARFYYVKAEAD